MGLFNPVADKLIELQLPNDVRQQVCSALIGGLQELDWDTEYESLERYLHDPAIVAAFAEHDVFPEEQEEDALRTRKQQLLIELAAIDEKLAGDIFDDPGDAP